MAGRPAGLTFSAAEIRRRLEVAAELMEDGGADALLLTGNRGDHADLLWLSGFTPSHEAALLIPRRGDPVLFVNHLNHVPQARELSWIADVRWGEDAAAEAARAEARRRGCAPPDEGAGPRLYRHRVVRSEEELALIRRAAELSDGALAALREQAAPGMTDFDLLSLVEAHWTARGARTGIAYLGVNRAVPAQHPNGVTLSAGDLVTVELSANFHGYWGQVLATFAAGGHPLPRSHARLLEVAQAAAAELGATIHAGGTAAELEAAGALIDRAGLAIIDDLVHLGGGGCYGPYVRTPATAHRPAPAFTYLAGMCVVVQPNVVTPDRAQGVQVGELMLVTPGGVERLHAG